MKNIEQGTLIETKSGVWKVLSVTLVFLTEDHYDEDEDDYDDIYEDSWNPEVTLQNLQTNTVTTIKFSSLVRGIQDSRFKFTDQETPEPEPLSDYERDLQVMENPQSEASLPGGSLAQFENPNQRIAAQEAENTENTENGVSDDPDDLLQQGLSGAFNALHNIGGGAR